MLSVIRPCRRAVAGFVVVSARPRESESLSVIRSGGRLRQEDEDAGDSPDPLPGSQGGEAGGAEPAVERWSAESRDDNPVGTPALSSRGPERHEQDTSRPTALSDSGPGSKPEVHTMPEQTIVGHPEPQEWIYDEDGQCKPVPPRRGVGPRVVCGMSYAPTGTSTAGSSELSSTGKTRTEGSTIWPKPPRIGTTRWSPAGARNRDANSFGVP